jgi:hypothetical protein
MKQIFLYKKEGSSIVVSELYAMVDDEDFDTLSKHRWFLMKIYHCNTDILYARRYEGSTYNGTYKAILMHRVILNATERSQKVDHKDSNGLNNQKDNIRISTHSENMSNRRVSYKKEIKYLGVYFNKVTGTYNVDMTKDGKTYAVFGIKTVEAAAQTYNELVLKYNPVYGKLNIV